MTSLLVRPDIEHADVAALRDAYSRMQELAASDNRSWIYWAEFHGFNRYDCWHHSRVGPGRGTEFSYDLFLPWHRAYLASFSHAVRDRNADAILPWWDWTSAAAHDHGLPASYVEADIDGQRNPLASGPAPEMPDLPAHQTQRFPGPPSGLPSLTEARRELGLNHSVNEILDLSQFVDFSSQLQDVHDYVHGWTGGLSPDGQHGGDMGVVATSAFDPIFWSHHAMLDRLWYLWQLKWGINNIPTEYLDKTLAPFPYRVRDVLDVHALGYEYAVSSTTSAVMTAAVHNDG